MFKFGKGGVHPADNKGLTAAKKIETPPLPPRLIVPLKQHIGAPCSPAVKTGDSVKKGQVIAEHPEKKAPPVHSPTSGKVKDIGSSPHPFFGMAQAVVIESDGKDEWLEGPGADRVSEEDFEKLSDDEIVDAVYRNGIVGMGGAAFPTHIKLRPPKDKAIDTLIINGAECEPYLTSDYRAMLEYPDRIIKGCRIMMRVLKPRECFIGIEDNKPGAVAELEKRLAGTGIRIALLKTRYPQGGEKMMIKAITGREVPSGMLPMDVGCAVQNVGTCIAVADAVGRDIPLIERIVTVSGRAVAEPKNLMLRIGTPFKDAFDFCGGFQFTPHKIIMGGPMMGIAQASAATPVIKSTSGIVALTSKESAMGEEGPCIRCGRCVEACTMRLRPYVLSILSEKRRHQAAQFDYDLLDCVECGCCTYVCPSRRNIVHYIKLSKEKNKIAAG